MEVNISTQHLLTVIKPNVSAHYKVLGINRKAGKLDKAELKKAYRQRSLLVHPDKNASPQATEAFKVVQDAFECLSDDNCANNYNNQLDDIEEQVQMQRERFKDMAKRHARALALKAHSYISIASTHIYKLGMDVWDYMGQFEVEIMEQNHKVG